MIRYRLFVGKIPSLSELEDFDQIPCHDDEDIIKIHVSPEKMYRKSSVLVPIKQYLANDKEPHSIKIQTLIKNYEDILEKTSSTDTSLNIVDTFVALICLQGVLNPLIYKKYDGHQALPIALNRLKWTWFYLKKICHDISCVNDQDLEIFLTSQLESFDEQRTSFSLLCLIAWNKLGIIPLSHKSNLKMSCINNSDQSEFSHSINWINLDKMTQTIYPLQTLQEKSSLMLTFVPQSLQQLYYYLIIAPVSSIDSLPLPVLLAHCLTHLEDVIQNDWNFYLSLFILQTLFKEYMLENYALALFWKKHSTDQFENNTRKKFLNVMKDHMLFDQPKDWQILINIERQRISDMKNTRENQEKDIRFFTASISLARLYQAQYHSHYGFKTKRISLSSPESKEVYLAITSILNPGLLIIAQSMILGMKDPFIFDDEQRDQLQCEIITLLQSLLPHLSLLQSTLLFIRCHTLRQTFSASFLHMAKIIGEKLNEISMNNQIQEQKAAYIALRQVNNSDLSHHLLEFAKNRKDLFDAFHFNSTIFHRYFSNITSFESSNTVLLSIMYLAELAFDAQILKIYTNEDQKRKISSWKELNQLWNDSSNYKKIMTYQIASWITDYLQKSEKDELHQIIEDVSSCLIIEKKALPMIEKWFDYRTNQMLKFFAQYAALLLMKEGLNIPGSIDIIREMFDIDCGLRLKSLVESLFNSQSIQPTTIHQLLVLLNQHIGYSLHISVFIYRKEMLELLLNLELKRITSNLVSTKSFLSIANGCSEDLQNYLAEYLYSFNNTQSEIKDEYLAIVFKWIIQISYCNNYSEDIWKELYIYIFTFLQDQQFPQVHQEILHALSSMLIGLDQCRRDVFMQDYIIIHLEKIIYSYKTYSENVISASLLIYGNYLLGSKMTKNLSDKMQNSLVTLFENSSSQILSIRAGLCLIFIQESNIMSNTIMNWFRNKCNITFEKRYNILLQQTLYPEAKFLSSESIDEVVKHINSDKLIDNFIIDLYNYLHSENNKSSNLDEYSPYYIFIALKIINENFNSFSNSVKNSSFGEEKLKKELMYLYLHSTSKNLVSSLLVKLYAAFGVLTIDLVDMLKWMQDHWDDDLWNYLKRIKQISDRNVIEKLFELLDLMAYDIKSTHVLYVAKFLIHLAEIHLISLLEVQQRIAFVFKKLFCENIFMGWRDENQILNLLLISTCLKNELILNSKTEVITENDIDEAFDRELQSVDKELALFLANNYFLTNFTLKLFC